MEENLNIDTAICLLVIKALNKHIGSKDKASYALGISNSTLKRYIVMYNIEKINKIYVQNNNRKSNAPTRQGYNRTRGNEEGNARWNYNTRHSKREAVTG